MALALRHSDALRPAIQDDWVPLALAAQLLALSPGHLRRKCAEWSGLGLARRFGGAWAVLPSADARLREVESWGASDRRQLGAARAAGVKPDYLDVAQARRDLLLGWDDFKCDLRTEAKALPLYLATARAAGRCGPGTAIDQPKPSTFRLWRQRYSESGIAGLIPAYGCGAGNGCGTGNDCGTGFQPVSGFQPAIGPAAETELRMLLLAGNNMRVGTAYRVAQQLAARHPEDPAWRLPSLRTVQLWWAAQPKALKVLANKGERAARAQCVPKMQRDYESIPAGDTYVGDERTFDVMCRVRTARGWKRFRGVKLTGWIDMRSKVLVGWVIRPYANSNTILGALKSAIRDHGKPRALVVDWGRDYRKAVDHAHTRTNAPSPLKGEGRGEGDSRRHERGLLIDGQRRWDLESFNGDHVGGVLDQLGIQVNAVTPYTPWAKPIESWFSVMKERFDKRDAAFWGGCPAERHEDRDAWSKGHVHLLPTIDDLTREFAQWLAEFHATPHGAPHLFGYTPQYAMQALRDGPVRTETPETLDHFFSEFVGTPDRPRFIGRDGVKYMGQLYGWGDPTLMRMQGEGVILSVQPEDLSRITVCDLRRVPIVTVTPAVLRYSNKQEAAEAARVRARALRPYRAEVREARDAIIYEPKTSLSLSKGEGRGEGALTPSPLKGEGRGEGDSPRLVAARPELESALRAVAEAASSVPPPEEPDDITLEELTRDDDALPPPLADDEQDDFEDADWEPLEDQA